MKRDLHKDAVCPVARTLARVGDGWSLLILRDAALGHTRFEDFRRRLGVAPNILTDRLSRLVEAGLLERRAYSTRPARDDYVLTAMGRDFAPVLDALKAFGEQHIPHGEAA